jgi:hypothetical protein
MKKTFCSLIIALIVLVFCQGANNRTDFEITMSYDRFHDSYTSVDSTQRYFPNNLFSEFTNVWYSGQLFAMQEPVIFSNSNITETYRFVWLRTFHNPIAIRIERQQDIYLLTWKLCDGAGGYEPGELSIAKQKQIDSATWNNFKQLLNQAGFWHMATEEVIVDILRLDGSQWILEGKYEDKYHVVDRWTPESGTYYECCNYLIGLTDLTFDERDKY